MKVDLDNTIQRSISVAAYISKSSMDIAKLICSEIVGSERNVHFDSSGKKSATTDGQNKAYNDVPWDLDAEFVLI
jgi:hypothetical protein